MEKALAERFPGAPSSNLSYLTAMGVAATSSSARSFSFTIGSNEVSVHYSHFSYPEELVEKIFTDFQDLPTEQKTLAIAFQAGLIAGAPRVDFESWDGSSGFRWKISTTSIKRETLSKPPWKDGGSACRMTVRFRVGLNREIFRVGGNDSSAESSKYLRERFRYTGARFEIDGAGANEEYLISPGLMEFRFAPDSSLENTVRKPKIVCEADLQEVSVSSGPYFAQFVYGSEEISFALICRGLHFPLDLPLAEELGFSGILVADHLRLNPQLDGVIEDSDFDDLLNDIESDLLNAAKGLVELIDKLEEDAVAEVVASLDIVVEAYRSSGDNEEAILILKKLVEVKSLGDFERASQLTQLARTLERDGQAEESFSYYGKALDSWGLVSNDEQDLEMVATALLGSARLMNIYDPDPDTAMHYTKNALQLRRSVGSDDDIEKGRAAELLGRMYLEHKRYPEAEFLEVEELLTEALHSFEQNYGKTHAEVANVLTNLGEFHRLRGSFEEAGTMMLRALAIQEKLLGSKHQAVGQLFDSLAAMFEAGGDVLKAGHYYARALEVIEHLQGAESEEVVRRLNDLVILYRVYGHFAKAEPLFLRLLKLREENEDETGQETVADLCSLALFYQIQKKYDLAEPLLDKARGLAEGIQIDGGSTLAWVHGLMGRFFDEQYLFKKAEPHLLAQVRMFEQALGEEHPDLVVAAEAVARHYRLQRDYQKAMPWAERALAIAETFYGGRHPYLATALNSFAELLFNAGDKEMARSVYLAAFEIHDKADSNLVGKDIPFKENSRLAFVRHQAERLHRRAAEPARDFSRFHEAETLYLQALFLREQVLGASHPDNARTLTLLADLYQNHHRYDGAERLYLRALNVSQEGLGESHPDCCFPLEKLTALHLLQGKFVEAEPYLENWLATVERALGSSHVMRSEVLVRQASLFENRGETEEQLLALQEAVRIRHSVFGTEHPTFAMTLAEMLRVEGASSRAAELYDFVLTSLEKNLGQDDVLLIPVLEKYSKVLLDLGEDERAAPLETRAMVMRVDYGLDFG